MRNNSILDYLQIGNNSFGQVVSNALSSLDFTICNISRIFKNKNINKTFYITKYLEETEITYFNEVRDVKHFVIRG